MIFEVRSIAFVTTINLVVIALAFFVQWLRERDPSLRDWSLGFGLGAIGSEMSTLRDSISTFASVTVGGTLLLMIFILTNVGLSRAFGHRPSRWIWLLPAVNVALFSYFTLVDVAPIAWPLMTGYMRFVICVIILAQLVKSRAQMSRYAALLLILSMLVMGLFMLTRGTLSLWLPQSYDFSASSAPAITYIVTAACTLAMMLGLLSLHVDQLLKKLETAANTDSLTGLCNRRHFNEQARKGMDRDSREGYAPWLLMIDVDHFKKINDDFGHHEGDLVLQALSQVLNESVRGSDIVARYGGEEFCVLLPNIEAQAARATAQRLLHSAAALRAGPQGDRAVSISIGAACLETSDHCLENLLKRADQALYDAKRQGRARVVGFSEEISEEI